MTKFGSHPRSFAIFPDFRRFFSPGNFQIFLVSSFDPKICMDILHIILNLSAKFQMKTPYIEEVTSFRKKCPRFRHFNGSWWDRQNSCLAL